MSLNLKAEDFLGPYMVVEIGREPMKIQVLTGIDGVSFDRCQSDRVVINLSGLPVPFIGFDSLLANKAASPGAETGSISRSSRACGTRRKAGILDWKSNSPFYV